MDITGTKNKIQRLSKIVEQSYKKINEMLERMQALQEDLETTSEQVDDMENDLARQRALLDAIAQQQGIDPEEVIAAADIPDEEAVPDSDQNEPTAQATSRPSADQ
jgi:uncharacterized protein YaaN involved in tellurite resistance